MLRTHHCGELNESHEGEDVILSGWVASRRDHGGIIFIDLRDYYGVTQLVFDPKHNQDSHNLAETVRGEWVIQVSGQVRARDKNNINPKMPTGKIEIISSKINILNKAQTLPFELDDNLDIREDLRLKYRYLDLRRPYLQKNLRIRHQAIREIRRFFDQEQFLEIETPIMIKGTPEGSREYMIPSRLHPGKFYVLPQSPQQLKQLLVLGGIDKYFQIARCFRDEDLRIDRQPEFTQFEIEMAFVEQEDVIQQIEKCFVHLNKNCAVDKNWGKFTSDGQFQRITWSDAHARYGSDKPDIRFGLEFCDISDLAQDCGFGIFAQSTHLFALPVRATEIKQAVELSRKDIDQLTELARHHGAPGLAWYRVGDDSGPVAKNAKADFLQQITQRSQAESGDLIFFGAGSSLESLTSLGAVRLALGDKYNLSSSDDFAYCWVVDFPLFLTSEDGTMQAAHHPFTRPHPEDFDKLTTDPLSVRALAYDIVLNGMELGGGSIRIHEPELQKLIFQTLKLTDKQIQNRFGHLLTAFQYGCPPHGGCAIGLDRLIMQLAGTSNIRDVIAFPKNQSACDLMLGAPSSMPTEAITEQNIRSISE